ncbi:calcium/sodium antiporter [Catellatospora bangladeshensis]|uniref:Sodium:calcium antiporter n=1 Tax=Catellatospora bangladeshensis TaxID=310355 RepID=A0A8J3JJH2_9ACTN|nr:calcium/sodium antiporter [Catellatospora bangladeshensis]GIF85937.1 sodium:calcium antiporter [Catellatospora bangladeshensis]
MLLNGLLIIAGLVALILGAEVLVKASAGLAARLGISPMIIGLTVVALGTSVPELAVGIDAALSGSPGLAMGNIIGASLVNLLLALGLSAALVPIVFDRATLRLDLPAMVEAALLLYLLSFDGSLTRPDGLILLLAGVTYTFGRIHAARHDVAGSRGDTPNSAAEPVRRRGPLRQLLLMLLGVAVVVVGAELLVEGAAASARAFGVSETVIGLTIVAIGTCTPELVTTVMSTLRGNRDLAIGNLLGSSIYNICAILGLTVVVAPHGIAVPREIFAADLTLMVAVTLVAASVFAVGARMSRTAGCLFIATYAAYLTWLLSRA